MEWDIFISHASEDKKGFVEPFAKQLKRHGYKVWYDKFCLKAGDSIRRSIETGLLNSKYGIVVLSNNFFKKDWPQREIDSLFALESLQKSKIIPIWLDITYDEVCSLSPLLADKYALNSSEGIDSIIEKLTDVLEIDSFLSNEKFVEKMDIYRTNGKWSKRYIIYRSIHNFNKLVCYNNEYWGDDNSPNDLEDIEGLDIYFTQKRAIMDSKYNIPADVYASDFDAIISISWINYITSMIKKWGAGKLGPCESYKLHYLLDEWFDLDHLFILFLNFRA